MRYCAACGEPIPRHTYKPIPAEFAKLILASARHPQMARAAVRHATRICPVNYEACEAKSGRQVMRAVIAPRAADEMQEAA